MPTAIPQPLSQQFYDTINGMLGEFTLPDWLRNPPAEPQPISRAERVQALAAIWAEAKVSFAYWERVPGLDWDGAFREYLPSVEAADDPADFYALLERFVALLSEGHTYVHRPPWLARLRSTVPVGLDYLEGQPVVIRGDVLPAGTVITHVDGRPAADILAELAPAMFASTDWSRMDQACRFLLTGPAGSTALVDVRLPDGQAGAFRLVRSGRPAPRPLLERVDLGEGRVLVRINSWADSQVVSQFDQAVGDFSGVQALIIDVRYNTGGNSQNGERVLARLAQRLVPYEISTSLLYWGGMRIFGLDRLAISALEEPLQPDGARPVFAGPVAVLTGPATFSAAEDFCLSFRCCRRGMIVGETTGGSTGNPVVFPLPGGGMCGISATGITYPDGTPLIGVGVVPDVLVTPTVAGIAAGRDEVLAAALERIGRE